MLCCLFTNIPCLKLLNPGLPVFACVQAEEIYGKFAQLERLKQNNWQPEVSAEAALPKAAKKVKVGPSV